MRPKQVTQYEFSNLPITIGMGNVLRRVEHCLPRLGVVETTTVTDKKNPVDVGNNGTIDWYVADITSATDSVKCYFETYTYKVQNLHWLMPISKSLKFDKSELLRIHNRYYYPFGSPMDGRTFSSDKYRFGFNGQEKDDEVAGAGNINTALFWEYDTRLGRRWNLDPEGSPDKSSYSAYSNNPILRIDPNGNTDFINSAGVCVATDGNKGNGRVIVVSDDYIKINMNSTVWDISDLPKDSYFELPSYADRQKIKDQVAPVLANSYHEVGGQIDNFNLSSPPTGGQERWNVVLSGSIYSTWINGKPSKSQKLGAEPFISAVCNVKPLTSVNNLYDEILCGNDDVIALMAGTTYRWHSHCNGYFKNGIPVDPVELFKSANASESIISNSERHSEWGDSPSDKDWESLDCTATDFIMGTNSKKCTFYKYGDDLEKKTNTISFDTFYNYQESGVVGGTGSSTGSSTE